ncbi:AP2 domain-containing protein [Pyrinomonas sp.]|uniref:AP2 domain-containing protein n=1 Tax=Pyrinomonas sp. TaxID=2080306 RepID=UPI00331B401D
MSQSHHKGISRIDCPQKRMHGWYVRVQFKNEKRAKFVSDQKYGGKEAALQKALEFRDKMMEELGRPVTECVIIGTNPRNKSGVVGVRRTVKKYRGKNGQIYFNEVYEVTWNAGRERRGRTSVSIKKYGEKEAFRRACAIRRQKEQELYGKPVVGKWADVLAKLCAA